MTPILHVGVLLGDPRLPYPYAIGGRFGSEEFEAVERLRTALAELDGYRFSYFDEHERLIDDLRGNRPDLVLNLCDTGYRNQGHLEHHVPALLEMLDIPYTGADPKAMSLSYDKALVSAAARMHGIRVPNESYVDLTADPLTLPTTYPALIKPNGASGSFGITEESVVYDPAEAEEYLRWLGGVLERPEALIQDFLTGPEYTVGLIGNPDNGFTVLPPLEVDFGGLGPELPALLTHGSKADPASPYWQKLEFKRAEVDDVTWAALVDDCGKLFRRLGFRDYARVDFRSGADGVPRLLDANVNPTWYWNGKMALMADWAGHDYGQMLRLVLEAAASRAGLDAA